MELEEIRRAAMQEAEWLRYYGHEDSRYAENFEDHMFYDRLKSIGYTKRVMPLPMRCAMLYLTADTNASECHHTNLVSTSGPRNHARNVYTALEYMIAVFPENAHEFADIIRQRN